MTLTKEKNNTYKQRTLPNYANGERSFKGSNGHETDINECQKWHSFLIRRLMRHSCDRAFKTLPHECCIMPHTPTHEKRMMLTKGEKRTHTHKQRKLHNDERPSQRIKRI